MVIMQPRSFLWPSPPQWVPCGLSKAQGHVFRPLTKNAGAKQRAKNTRRRPEIRPSVWFQDKGLVHKLPLQWFLLHIPRTYRLVLNLNVYTHFCKFSFKAYCFCLRGLLSQFGVLVSGYLPKPPLLHKSTPPFPYGLWRPCIDRMNYYFGQKIEH